MKVIKSAILLYFLIFTIATFGQIINHDITAQKIDSFSKLLDQNFSPIKDFERKYSFEYGNDTLTIIDRNIGTDITSIATYKMPISNIKSIEGENCTLKFFPLNTEQGMNFKGFTFSHVYNNQQGDLLQIQDPDTYFFLGRFKQNDPNNSISEETFNTIQDFRKYLNTILGNEIKATNKEKIDCQQLDSIPMFLKKDSYLEYEPTNKCIYGVPYKNLDINITVNGNQNLIEELELIFLENLGEEKIQSNQYRVLELFCTVSKDGEVGNINFSHEIFWYFKSEEKGAEVESLNLNDKEEIDLAKELMSYMNHSEIDELKQLVKSQDWSAGKCNGEKVKSLIRITLFDL